MTSSGARSRTRSPGKPIFQAAAANLNPWTEAKVDTKNPERGPMLIVSGEQDHTVPWKISHASYKRGSAIRASPRS
jgi:non-heme chloroperoxidase